MKYPSGVSHRTTIVDRLRACYDSNRADGVHGIVLSYNMGVDELYRELIIDHYKHPRNFGELNPRDAEAYAYNPLCGDELGVHLRLEGDVIADVRFHGQGCAISQAAASIVSEELRGMTISGINSLGREWLTEQLGFDLTAPRLKCGLLSLEAVRQALRSRAEQDNGAENARCVLPEPRGLLPERRMGRH